MGRIISAAFLLLALACLAHATDPVEVVTTTDGKTFNHVTVVSVKGDKVLLSYQNADGGIAAASVALDSLSDETRKALGLRTRAVQGRIEAQEAALRADQEAFEAEQAKKGLVKYGHDWVTPEDKKRREADATAQWAVDAQSQPGVTFIVSQALKDGSLCYMGPTGAGDQFFLYGPTNKFTADGDTLNHDLYYSGNYSYTTVERAERTVKSYAWDRNSAIEIVKIKWKLLTNERGVPEGKERREEEARDAAAERVVDSQPPWFLDFQVSKALENGSLCTRPGEIFYLYGATLIADGRVYHGDTFFWAGDYTYYMHRRIKSYAVTRKLAIEMVKAKLNLLPHDGDSTPATKSAGLDNVRRFGTGFAITDDGYIITAYHVISNAKSIRVKNETELLEAKVVAADKDNDLALLKVNKKTECVAFSSARTASLGQTVFTVGFPMPDIQGFSPKVTKGVISGLKGIKDDVRRYQIDASVQAGNSGGPLADERGNVVGVVVAKLNDAAVMEETGDVPQNVNYTVKLAYVLALVDANPEVAKKIHLAKDDNAKLSFEEAVEKVRKATVIIASY